MIHLKWLATSIALVIVAAVSYLLFRQSAKINDLQDSLLDAKVQVEKDKVFDTLEKQKVKYDEALQVYLDSIGSDSLSPAPKGAGARPVPPGPGRGKLTY